MHHAQLHIYVDIMVISQSLRNISGVVVNLFSCRLAATISADSPASKTQYDVKISKVT